MVKVKVFHNGKELAEKEKAELEHLDRLVLGQEILLFMNSSEVENDSGEAKKEMTAREILQEYYEGKNKHDEAYQKQAQKLLQEKQQLEQELQNMRKQGESEAAIKQKKKEAQIWKAVDETMLQTLPVIQSMEQLCKLVNRSMLSFKLSLQQPKDDVPSVKVHVTYKPSGNELTESNEVFIDPFELQSNLDLFRDQIKLLKSAALNKSESYTVPVENDIITELFDTSYHFGSCTNFLLHCTLNMETDPEDINLDLMKSVIPYNKVGELEVVWTPNLTSETGEEHEYLEPQEMLGKKWSYTLKIGKLKKLTSKIREAYVEYEFNGEKFVTETLSVADKREVDLQFDTVHVVEEVTEEFLTYLDEVELKFNVFIKPSVVTQEKQINSEDRDICNNLGVVVAEEAGEEQTNSDELNRLRAENRQLKEQLQHKDNQIEELKIKESKLVQRLRDAKAFDQKLQEGKN